MATNDIDPSALNDWSRPVDRARAELICLGRTLMPDDATAARTLTTLVFIGVWAVMVVAPMLNIGDPPRWELTIAVTAVVFTILGRMWDFEVKRALNTITISTDGGRPNQEDNDRDR